MTLDELMALVIKELEERWARDFAAGAPETGLREGMPGKDEERARHGEAFADLYDDEGGEG